MLCSSRARVRVQFQRIRVATKRGITAHSHAVVPCRTLCVSTALFKSRICYKRVLFVFGSYGFVDRAHSSANMNDPRIHTKEYKRKPKPIWLSAEWPSESRRAIDERAHLADVRIKGCNAVENYFDGLVWKARLKCERVAGEDIARIIRAPKQEIMVR